MFTFGAILAVTVYGLAPGDVLIFGVAVVAAPGAVVAGFADDRVGPTAVIVVPLGLMIATMTVLLFVDGTAMFWVIGLLPLLPVRTPTRAEASATWAVTG